MRYKWNYQDDLEEYTDDQPQPVKQPRPKKATREQVVSTLIETGDDTRQGFNPSFGSKSADKYNVSRHERAWISQYFSGFYEDKQLIDVIKPVKGGKEATVYCCLAGPSLGVELVAAKLYRPRIFRNLRNDSLYRMGRDMVDESGKSSFKRREGLAIAKGTRFGRDLRQLAWANHEVAMLERLYAAGGNVPRTYASTDHAILMDYYGTADMAASTLAGTTLRSKEARPLFDLIVHNIEIMLENKIIHGDLSAHNILYWEGNIQLIDFPQAVDPYVNPYAYGIYVRDVTRVCQYFERYGIKRDPEKLAADIWSKHVMLVEH
ncbi:MAG: RIO1 family regulatory kinase/ATPase [Chloroflexia bacterium]